MEIIQGVIGAVVFQNYDNGYAVLRLNVGGGQHVTVVAVTPHPQRGSPGWGSVCWRWAPVF